MSETTEPTAAAIAAAPEVTIDAPKADVPADAAAAPRFSFKPRLSRVSILALAIAVSAALGSMVGALAGAALVRSHEPDVTTATAAASKSTFSSLSADIAALKASVDASSKAAKAQAQQLAERIERAEKAADQAKTAKAQASAPETTGSIAVAPKEAQRAPIVDGWVLRDVLDGRAVIENRYGLYEVIPGSNVPGLGRIETIKRIDGRWAVVTPRGLITAAR